MKRNKLGQFLPDTGLSRTKLGQVWRHMLQRVENPTGNNKCYLDISVCDAWQQLQPFYDWALANGYKEGLSIDRKNRKGNYEPDNCRWVNAVTQSQNRGKTSRNSTGYKGVYKSKPRTGKKVYANTALTPYYYLVIYNHKRHQGWGYATAKDASKARAAFIQKHYPNEVYAN